MSGGCWNTLAVVLGFDANTFELIVTKVWIRCLEELVFLHYTLLHKPTQEENEENIELEALEELA